MITSEAVIRDILGPIRQGILPLTYATEIAAELIFDKHMAMDDIRITKDIYPDVAKLLKKRRGAVTRTIERLANLCWDKIDSEKMVKYIGQEIENLPAPRYIIFYLAYYIRLGEPVFDVIERDPSTLF